MSKLEEGAWARRGIPVAGALLLVCLLVGGCSNGNAALVPSQTTAGGEGDSSIPQVLATIGDEPITLADIEARAGDGLATMEGRYRRSRHALIEATLRDVLRERVLLAEATRQGSSVEQLIEAEAGGSVEPSAAEVETWYRNNPERVAGRPLEEIRAQVTDLLRGEKRKAASARLDERLNRDRKVTVKLPPFRVAFDDGKAPAQGPADARVTLVEFSDFQCPYCQRFHSVLKRLEASHGDSIRIVYRQFPIPSLHPNAFKAAEASLCANDQGRFWELHDVMFREQDRLTVRELKEQARRVGLDAKTFDTCLDTGAHTEQVQEDMKEGSRVGVTGTPALFLNGVEVPGGAVSYETLVEAIRRESARVKR